MSTPANPPAFPTVTSREAYTGDHFRTVHDSENGMSLRDYFAAMAMSGSLGGVPGGHLAPENLARESYAHADAMLAERSKP
jgi:hypothetical protein